VAARNSAEVFGLLEQGRVDAVAFSAAYLEGLRLQSPRPQSYAFMAGTVKTEPVAIVFRLADERLHALANEVIADLMRTGELARLYDKWFVRQVPGLPAPLNLPLPDALRRMFAQPGSELHDL
jgi:glutamate/aspartate transport system substrate-binding protein